MNEKDLQIKEVCLRRVFNLGNYETLAVEYTATVGPGQSPKEVTQLLDKATMDYRKSREA